MFDGGCVFVILGILAGIGVGLLFSFWAASHMFNMHPGPVERLPAEACRTDDLVAVTVVVLSIVAVGAILPAGRKLLGEDRSESFDRFAVAFGLTLFCPFLPCTMILISQTLSSGACPL
jgi:hypothetical protein